MENKLVSHLSKGTRSYCVTSCVFAAICTIVLMIVNFIFGVNETLIICAIASALLMLLFSILFGVTQLKVSNDYRMDKKSLSTDGIISISISILISATLWLFFFTGIGDNKSEYGQKLVYVVFFLLLVYSVCKFIQAIYGIKNKRYNWWAELLLAILWLADGVFILLINWGDPEGFMLWGFAIDNYLVVIATIVYLLYSYIYNVPVYLETPESNAALKAEEIARNERMARFNQQSGLLGVAPQPIVKQNVAEDIFVDSEKPANESIEVKLAKLDSLLTKHIITEEEYAEKRKKIIDESI